MCIQKSKSKKNLRRESYCVQMFQKSDSFTFIEFYILILSNEIT